MTNWKLVPVEPTQAMQRMGAATYHLSVLDAYDIYEEMLTAAPDPTDDAELVERIAVALREVICAEEPSITSWESSTEAAREAMRKMARGALKATNHE